ncbi:NAD-dependent epimerase/dehydratase family protein [Sediminitomix flava]|uniref:Nucleoside-diphosphate-sugar epimerase n=1 Tax=Sediminitomix flava TaxID=379075 RepID=A0A315Z8P3_SEDFL|nr:NAD(P)-dependent oxidoreductase [Sediminitomix flava]PWJ41946.1 nucleoside-diphosphate-sugar epimerase [Sediminitomix flava]
MEASRKIIVIGGAGFIARAFIQEVSKTYTVISFDKKTPTKIFPEEHFTECDLGKKEDIEVIKDCIKKEVESLHGIVFLAAYYDFSNKPNPFYQDVYNGFCDLVDFHSETLPSTIKFIFSSSMASMLPTTPGIKQTEDSPRKGMWQYPYWKLEMEKYLEGKKLQHPFFSLVLAAVYSDNIEIVPLYHLVKNVSEKKIERFFYPSDTNRGLTYVHLDDVVKLLLKVIENDTFERGYHRFLIGEEEALTYHDIHSNSSKIFLNQKGVIIKIPKSLTLFGAKFLGFLSSLLNKRRFVQAWMIELSDEHYEFDISKVRNELGWQPERNIKEELPKLLQAAKDNYETWKTINEKRPW